VERISLEQSGIDKYLESLPKLPVNTKNGFAVEARRESIFTQRLNDLSAILRFFVDLQRKKFHSGQKLLRMRIHGKDQSFRPFDIHFEDIDSRDRIVFHEFADCDAFNCVGAFIASLSNTDRPVPSVAEAADGHQSLGGDPERCLHGEDIFKIIMPNIFQQNFVVAGSRLDGKTRCVRKDF